MDNIIFIPFAAIGFLIFESLFLGISRLLGLYTTVGEREAKVYVLFGDVLGVLDKPGLHFPIEYFGWKTLFVGIFGEIHTRSLSLDQEYIRSIPVNSEEGTPMGIGVWI